MYSSTHIGPYGHATTVAPGGFVGSHVGVHPVASAYGHTAFGPTAFGPTAYGHTAYGHTAFGSPAHTTTHVGPYGHTATSTSFSPGRSYSTTYGAGLGGYTSTYAGPYGVTSTTRSPGRRVTSHTGAFGTSTSETFY